METEKQPEATAAAPVNPSEPVELVRKVYARDLREGNRVTTVFRVAKKQKASSRSGKTFLVLGLVDRTGEIDARVFDDVEKREATFAEGDFVLVQGEVILHHGHPQIVIAQLERLDPEPIDVREFTPPAKREPEPSSEKGDEEGGRPDAARAVGQLREQVERVHDAHVKSLLFAVLDDPAIAAGLPVAHGAKGVHHNFRGGLAEHLASSIRLAHRLADQYPAADRDLLIAGALLHDLGRARDAGPGGEPSDEGRLVGHAVLTAQLIAEKASRLPGFPPLLTHHLTHLVLAHDGGVAPVTLEALLVHHLHQLDATVSSWLEHMGREGHERWTEANRQHTRPLWRGAVPTSRNRGPVEPGRRRKRDRDDRPRRVPRPPPSGRKGAPREEAAAAGTAPTEAAPARVEEKAASPEPKPRDAGLPKDLAFKPFAMLAGAGESGGDEPK